MSNSDALDAPASRSAQKRRLTNAVWQPFVQFKLLMYMLGTTALVALMLASFLYYAFSDLIGAVTNGSGEQSYYAEMIEIQLIHLFRYCGALFVLYILLLAAVCVAYTHKLIGPLRPFSRHVDELVRGNYQHRVKLRTNDLEMFDEYAAKLNELAEKLDRQNHES